MRESSIPSICKSPGKPNVRWRTEALKTRPWLATAAFSRLVNTGSTRDSTRESSRQLRDIGLSRGRSERDVRSCLENDALMAHQSGFWTIVQHVINTGLNMGIKPATWGIGLLRAFGKRCQAPSLHDRCARDVTRGPPCCRPWSSTQATALRPASHECRAGVAAR